VHVQVCGRAYVYILYIYVRIYMCANTFRRTVVLQGRSYGIYHIHMYMCIIHIYIYILHMCTYVHIYTNIYFVYVYISIYVNVFIFTYIYIRVHTHSGVLSFCKAEAMAKGCIKPKHEDGSLR